MSISSGAFSEHIQELKMNEKLEPLLINDESRYVYLPLKFPIFDKLWEQAQASNWTVGEIKLDTDRADYCEKLSKDEQRFISCILAFFASADGIVNENLVLTFSAEVQAQELRCFYATQQHIEAVHSKTYATLIETIIPEPRDQAKLFNAVNNFPCIRKKADWCLKWINKDLPFHVRVVAFIIIEGLFFSGSFAAIFWLKKRGLMHGLTFSNELISRDEGLHVNCGVHVRKTLKYSASDELVKQMMIEAVTVEKEFFHEILPFDMLGMNKRLMCEYIEYVADFLLYEMSCPKHYLTPNPFDFMESISLQGKTNFFERRVGEYQKSGSMGNNDHIFTLDSDF